MVNTLSLVVPVFNKGRCLKSVLESIIRAKDRYLEIIFVNDASTDDSLQIIKNHQSVLPNLRIVDFQENQGPDRARKEGIRLAKTDWVQLLDADDLLVDSESIFSSLKQPPLRDLKNISALCAKNKLREMRIVNSIKDIMVYGWPDASNIIIKREAVDFSFRRKIDWGEDHVFFMSLFSNGSFIYLPGKFANYRQDYCDRSINNGSLRNRLICALEIFNQGRKLSGFSAWSISTFFVVRTLVAWAVKRLKLV